MHFRVVADIGGGVEVPLKSLEEVLFFDDVIYIDIQRAYIINKDKIPYVIRYSICTHPQHLPAHGGTP